MDTELKPVLDLLESGNIAAAKSLLHDLAHADRRQPIVDLLENDNVAGAKALLHDLVHPGKERPAGIEYPKWVDHPTGAEPSQVADTAEKEKRILSDWAKTQKTDQRGTTTQSAGSLPGASVPHADPKSREKR